VRWAVLSFDVREPRTDGRSASFLIFIVALILTSEVLCDFHRLRGSLSNVYAPKGRNIAIYRHLGYEETAQCVSDGIPRVFLGNSC
jgi:hypothetical protein